MLSEAFIPPVDFSNSDWDPNRSKIRAAIENGLLESYLSVNRLLYLGCAHGYTVSHIHKMCSELYAVDACPEVMRHFLPRAEKMENTVPILGDASRPDAFAHLLPSKVDLIFQDIAQKHQTDIFLANCRLFLSAQGVGMLCVKAPAVNSSVSPDVVFDRARQQLMTEGATIVQEISLNPFHSHHKVFVLHMSPYDF